MYSTRKTAVKVGILYIIGTVAGVVSVVFTDVLNQPDFLTLIPSNSTQIALGALCVFVMAFALAFIPFLMFPLLKKQDEALSLGYTVFRGALEPAGVAFTVIAWLSLPVVSAEYLHAAAANSAFFQSLASMIVGVADISGVFGTFAFCLGAIIFYTLLYRSQLIPRWISVWGLIAIFMHLAYTFLWMFAVLEPFSTISVVVNLPIAIQEMVMAVWFIAKGFNLDAVKTLTAGKAGVR